MAESKRAPGPFSFCTKHKGSFYASCKCPIPGSKKAQKELTKEDTESVMEDIPQPEGLPAQGDV